MQYEIVIKSDRWCSCYTCLPRTAPVAAQTGLKINAAPSTSTGAPPVAQRLLTNTWPKQGTTISIQAHTSKNYETVQKYMKTAYKTRLELLYALQRSRGYKERLKRS